MLPSSRYLTFLIPIFTLIASLACSDDAEHIGGWPEVPEVVEVTFSGTAGEQDSKFIVRFNEPVIVVKGAQNGTVKKEVEVKEVVIVEEVVKTVEVPGETVVVEKEVVKEVMVPGETVVVEVEKVVEVDPNAYDSDSSVTLEIGYSGYGSGSRIPLQTKTSPDKPSNELSFGPINREFAVAYGILLAGDANITDIDGNQALLDFGSAASTVFVNPEYKDDIADPKLVNCVAIMELLGFSPIIIDNVKNLRSDTLVDSERIEWRLLLNKEFSYGIGNIMSLPCQRLWSEAVSPENENKRNHDSNCIVYLSQGSGTHSDAIELMNRPFNSLDASDRILLRLVLDSDSGLSSECAMFYPQLFYGRWIPMSRDQ
ncbi:MAG: hypothetical protein OXC95_08295 [Dehalococcoidia bacterium]|nr:hypothetical protein [Dehalococcoidia bacterium]